MSKVPVSRRAFRGNVRQAMINMVNAYTRLVEYNLAQTVGSGLPLTWPASDQPAISSVMTHMQEAMSSTYPPAMFPS